jgi:hypothetical protein
MSKVQKSLLDICNEKGIKTTYELFQIVKDRKLRILSDIGSKSKSGHNYKPRFKQDGRAWSNNVAISNTLCLGNDRQLYISSQDKGTTGIYIYEVGFDEETKEDIEKDLEFITSKFVKEEADLKEKIAIMNELSMDIYDEKLIKLVKAMSNIEFKKGSDMDKVTLAKLLIETV